MVLQGDMEVTSAITLFKGTLEMIWFCDQESDHPGVLLHRPYHLPSLGAALHLGPASG